MNEEGILENSGERMIPEFHDRTLMYAEHYSRYLVAQDLVRDKIVLDIASGSGYGSHLLSQTAKRVIGVDYSSDAVAYATSRFGGENVEYRQGDAVAIPLEDDSVDVVITLETIEHIADYRAFVAEIARVLRPDGLAVISTPNDLEFAEGNHYHLHEFEYEELLDLVRQHFSHVDPYFQATWKAVAVGTEELLRQRGVMQVQTINLAPLERDQFLYFYLLCSNRDVVESIDPLVALGGHYSDRALAGLEADREAAILDLRRRLDEETERAQEQEQRARRAEEELQRIRRSRRYRAMDRLAAVKNRLPKL